MSNAAKSRAKAVVVAEEPQLIPTKWARVAFYGCRNISKRMLEILGMCLGSQFWEDGDHGVRAVFLGDFGLKHTAESWPEVKAVAIDLEQLFEKAIDRCRTTQVNSSIFSWYTLNMILAMFHEAHHTSQIAAGERLRKDEEKKAEKFAHETLFEMAKTFKVEPDEWTQEPFFHDAALGGDLLTDTGGEYASFLERQLDMLDNRLFFHMPRTEEVEAVKCHSFKEYLCFMETGKVHDESWLGTPIPVAPVAVAAADVSPDMPATQAVRTMGEQAGNIAPPVETTPAENVIALGPPLTPQQQYEHLEKIDPSPETVLANAVMTATNGLEGQAAIDAAKVAYETTQGGYNEYLEDMEAGEEYAGDDAFIDTRVDTVAPSTPAAGAPGTPFIMNGQPVGVNVPPTPLAPAPEVMVYPPTSMDDQTLIAVIQGIYAKCYEHIFSYCGQHQTGFTHPSKVYELQLELTEQEAEAVVKMDCLDANGRWCPGLPTKVQSNTGTITARLLGAETKNTKLPYYKLYLNGNGKEICRMLLPQNPLKQTNGQFSKPALAAQSGSRIMYVFEGNDAIVKAGGRKVVGKFVDGRWES